MDRERPSSRPGKRPSEFHAGSEGNGRGSGLSFGCYNPGMANENDNQGHARIDARSLAMHRAIAAKLLASPELFAIAKDNLKRWRATAGRSLPYLDAWDQVLTRPAEEVLELMRQDNEAMRAMRQASPFAGVLSPKERWKIYDAFAVGTYHSGGGSHRG